MGQSVRQDGSLTSGAREDSLAGDQRDEIAALLDEACDLLDLEAHDHADGITHPIANRRNMEAILRSFTAKARSALKLARGEK